jgi:hypothetical protein
MPHNQSGPVLLPSLYYEMVCKSGARLNLSYPQNTKAFLYYFTPPEKPRIAGQLRLRVASSDDPASFDSGSDLLISNGQPWLRRLCTVSKHYISLYQKLREEQLVSDDLDAVLSTFPHKSPTYHRSQVLYTLDDTFIVDFSTYQPHVFAVTEKGIGTTSFGSPFIESVQGREHPTQVHIQITIS